MAKKEIHCCTECGRDTTRQSQICKVCMPTYHRSNSKTEQIGRSALSTDRLLDDTFDERRPPLKHVLR